MQSKHTLLIVDGDHVKVVFGDRLKCIKFSEMGLDYNVDFLDAIFCNTDVVMVDKISRISRENFDHFVKSKAQPQREKAPRDRRERAEAPEAPDGDDGPDRHASDPITGPNREGDTGGFVPQGGGDVYVISTDDRMTLIIDDVYTGRKISRPGMTEEETLVMEPGKPVNLGTLDKESVKKSASTGILSRMLRNGTIRQIPQGEAAQLLRAYEERSTQVLSALDWKSGGSAIIGDGTPGSAAKFAEDRAEDTDAETIEVTAGPTAGRPAPRPHPQDLDAPAGGAIASEGGDQYSLTDLMGMIEEDEAAGRIAPQKNPYTGFKRAGGP